MSIYECDQEWEIERLLNQVREETYEKAKIEVKEEVKAEVKEEVKAEVKEEVELRVKEETRAQVKCEFVTNMCNKGFSVEEACELAGITVEQYHMFQA